MTTEAPRHEPLDDLRALVERAIDRDPDAWEALYRRSYPALYGFARRRLFDPQAAEDTVSETMTRALDNIDRFTWQGGGFDAWLYGIARNVIHEHVRSDRRTVAVGPQDRPAIDSGPEERAVATSEAATMRRAFDRLDDGERELLELRVVGGLTSDEVGQILGKQPGTIRMAQARALQRLRTMLDEVNRAH